MGEFGGPIDLIDLIFGAVIVFLLFCLPNIHNRRFMEKFKRDMVLKRIDELRYIDRFHDTTTSLFVRRHSYGGENDYDNFVRSALCIGMDARIFIVEKGGSLQCKSTDEYIITGSKRYYEIEGWVNRHMPGVTMQNIQKLVSLIRKCNGTFINGTSQKGVGEFERDILYTYIEEFGRDVVDAKRILMLEKTMLEADRISVDALMGRLTEDEANKFKSRIEKLGNERLLRYCDMLDKAMLDDESNKWELCLAVGGYTSFEQHSFTLIRFENGTTPIFKEIWRVDKHNPERKFCSPQALPYDSFDEDEIIDNGIHNKTQV